MFESILFNPNLQVVERDQKLGKCHFRKVLVVNGVAAAMMTVNGSKVSYVSNGVI